MLLKGIQLGSVPWNSDIMTINMSCPSIHQATTCSNVSSILLNALPPLNCPSNLCPSSEFCRIWRYSEAAFSFCHGSSLVLICPQFSMKLPDVKHIYFRCCPLNWLYSDECVSNDEEIIQSSHGERRGNMLQHTMHMLWMSLMAQCVLAGQTAVVVLNEVFVWLQ